MNKQEAIEKVEGFLMYKATSDLGICVNRQDVIDIINQIDKKPFYLRNVLARLRELSEHDREIWLKAIMSEFERDFSHANGYDVEQEKRYEVKLKNTDDYLVKTNNGDYHFYSNIYIQNRKHTRKELEDAGFGWVFDCEGAEVREVE